MNAVNRMLATLVVIGCLMSGCTRAQQPLPAKVISQYKRVLIVYLSRTNNTKAVAEIIHQHTGGDLVRIELQTEYPKDYETTVKQVARENAAGYLPPLKTQIDSIDRYDLIFIGFPTWGMQLPPPVKSFLRQHKFDGKTIVPFNTNAGYGIGTSFTTVKELCSKSTVLEGFSIKGGVERDGVLFVMEGEKEKVAREAVTQWLSSLKIVQ